MIKLSKALHNKNQRRFHHRWKSNNKKLLLNYPLNNEQSYLRRRKQKEKLLNPQPRFFLHDLWVCRKDMMKRGPLKILPKQEKLFYWLVSQHLHLRLQNQHLPAQAWPPRYTTEAMFLLVQLVLCKHKTRKIVSCNLSAQRIRSQIKKVRSSKLFSSNIIEPVSSVHNNPNHLPDCHPQLCKALHWKQPLQRIQKQKYHQKDPPRMKCYKFQLKKYKKRFCFSLLLNFHLGPECSKNY